MMMMQMSNSTYQYSILIKYYPKYPLGDAKSTLLSVGFICEANQPDHLNPGGQRGKPNFAFLCSRFKWLVLLFRKKYSSAALIIPGINFHYSKCITI